MNNRSLMFRIRLSIGSIFCLISFMDQILQNVGLCSFLVGVLPVLFARRSRARVSALVFACTSIGLGLYLFLSDAVGSRPEGWRRAGFFIVTALVLAYASLIITFRLNKNDEIKSLSSK